MKAPTTQTVRMFLRQKTEESHSDAIPIAEIFETWSEWCGENRVYHASKQWFAKSLNQLDVPRMKRHGIMIAVGMKWRETPSTVAFGEDLDALSGPAWRQLSTLFTDNGYGNATARLSLG